MDCLLERALRLRAGDEGEALIAPLFEMAPDPTFPPPIAALALDAETRAPVPGGEPVGVLWYTAEQLRIDAGLLLWHDTPAAIAAAEVKLLRALEIAREQSALSWELRPTMVLARCGVAASPGGS